MVAVAVDAAWRKGVAAGAGLAMQRHGEQGLLIRMTGAAVDAGQLLLVRKLLLLEVGVAVRAVELSVNRGGKPLLVHKKRYGSAASLALQRLIAMTHQAVIDALPKGMDGEIEE